MCTSIACPAPAARCGPMACTWRKKYQLKSEITPRSEKHMVSLRSSTLPSTYIFSRIRWWIAHFKGLSMHSICWHCQFSICQFPFQYCQKHWHTSIRACTSCSKPWYTDNTSTFDTCRTACCREKLGKWVLVNALVMSHITHTHTHTPAAPIPTTPAGQPYPCSCLVSSYLVLWWIASEWHCRFSEQQSYHIWYYNTQREWDIPHFV